MSLVTRTIDLCVLAEYRDPEMSCGVRKICVFGAGHWPRRLHAVASLAAKMRERSTTSQTTKACRASLGASERFLSSGGFFRATQSGGGGGIYFSHALREKEPCAKKRLYPTPACALRVGEATLDAEERSETEEARGRVVGLDERETRLRSIVQTIRAGNTWLSTPRHRPNRRLETRGSRDTRVSRTKPAIDTIWTLISAGSACARAASSDSSRDASSNTAPRDASRATATAVA